MVFLCEFFLLTIENVNDLKLNCVFYVFLNRKSFFFIPLFNRGIHVNHHNLNLTSPANFPVFPKFLHTLNVTQPNDHAAFGTNDSKIATENVASCSNLI